MEGMKEHTLSRKFLLVLGAAALLGAPALEAQLTLKINFGGNSEATWNNLGTTGLPSSTDLLDDAGNLTGITLATTGLTSGSYSSSLGVNGTGLADFPDAVTLSYIYEGPNNSTTEGVITLGNLDVGTLYEVTVYGGRATTDPRITDYALTGLTSETLSLNVSNNTSTVTFAALKPAVDGSLALSFQSGTTSLSDYGYLNGMIVTAVPEPATYGLVLGLLALTGILVRRQRMS
jgi:hypothetical protein